MGGAHLERIPNRINESGEAVHGLTFADPGRRAIRDRSPPPRANLEFSGTIIACACAASVLAVALWVSSGALRSAASHARAMRVQVRPSVTAFMRVNDAGCRQMIFDYRTGLFRENVSTSCDDAGDVAQDSGRSRIDWIREHFWHH